MTQTHSTHDLVARLTDLLRNERRSMADFISELAEFDRRRCWEELGYPSLFEFLARELGLSRGNAFYRTKAVFLVHRFPEVLAALREGKLCITSIAEVARVMTAENRAEVVEREQVSMASASIHPLNSAAANALNPMREAAPEPRRDVTDPLTADLSRLHLTVTRELLAKVEAARLALSHAHPGATIADILELGADAALATDAKRKGLVANPRPRRAANQPTASASDHVPAEIRREVWRRDGGCCQWKLASGAICGSKMRPQLDHVVPKGKGGQTTIENLRVLCERHNQYAARLAYGDERMARYRRAPVAHDPSPC